jgi:2-aminobenzoylacetyl-CoA thioesterase
LLVVTGEGSSEFLSHPKAAQAIVTEDQHMAEFLRSQGIKPGRPSLDEPPTFQNCLVARDGDEMDLGNITLRYFTVKGHSPGEIVIHIPEINALILSDSLGFRYPGRGIFPLFLTDYSDYLAALDKLQNLNPTIIGPAHQGPIVGNDVEQAFAEARREAMTLRAQIMNDARPSEEVAQDIFDKYYRDECRMYTPENIMNCARLLVKRVRE